MEFRIRNRGILIGLVGIVVLFSACKKEDVSTEITQEGDTSVVDDTEEHSFDINSIRDTYSSIAAAQFQDQWSVYNVHDPSIKKFGAYYYCFSTDVAFGEEIRPGIQVRRSKDLVEWHFQGWAFSDIPSEARDFIKQHGGQSFNAIWAPYVLKVNDEYRLYYSLSSSTPRLSVIGLAVASSLEGPWTQRGLVVESLNDNSVQTNAIDPSVVVTPSGEEYMYYGSAWDGIYVLKLDPTTGLAADEGDIGKRVVVRGTTNGQVNGNIEAPEIIYNDSIGKYYLFMSYDWLETKYNVRVGRSNNPEGPFIDFKGDDMNVPEDHFPMILAPYQFNGHGGWQGTGGEAVFSDKHGNYFMGHNARPSVNKYFMDLHIRKIFWTQDGWPVVSPERYAWEGNHLVAQDSIIGEWEQIILGYQVVPGYENEQTDPDLQQSVSLSINADGALNDDPASTWTYNAPWLIMNWGNGYTDKVFVQKGRDWENHSETVIFSGLNNDGTAIWGKKSN